MKKSVLVAASLMVLGCMAPAHAKDITVQMKNNGAGGMMVFEPSLVMAMPGDRIHFVPTDKGHNAEPINGMLPAGVTLGNGKMNEEYIVTASKPGLYGIKCLPHFSMGMIALIKVGKGAPANLAAVTATAMPPLAKKRMDALLAQVR